MSEEMTVPDAHAATTDPIETHESREVRTEARPISMIADLYWGKAVPTLAAGVERGAVDQELFYDHSAIPEAWQGVTEDTVYQNYSDCQDTLRKTIRSDEWRALEAEEPVTFVADLGVGNGSKASTLVNLLQQSRSRKASVLGIDVSMDLLNVAIPFVERNVPDGVRVAGARCDFSHQLPELFNTPALKEWLGPHDGRRLFSLLGNTACNFEDEATYLNSLSQAARKGDVVVFGLEFASNDSGDVQAPDAMLAEYGSVAYARFVYAGVKPILRSSFVEFSEGMRVYASKGFSRIPHTVSLVTDGWINGRRVKLIHSNRFHIEEFQRYVEDFGFNLRFRIWADANPFYAYAVFERSSRPE